VPVKTVSKKKLESMTARGVKVNRHGETKPAPAPAPAPTIDISRLVMIGTAQGELLEDIKAMLSDNGSEAVIQAIAKLADSTQPSPEPVTRWSFKIIRDDQGDLDEIEATAVQRGFD
jgi:hypothetical protein